MNDEELCKKRLYDLSNQAFQKEIVLFSDFLTLNEINIYQSQLSSYYTKTKLFGGYEFAERQMVAFIPDALYYEWDFPFKCLKIMPKYPKFAEKLSHRDVLGALMSLGIERSKFGDIVCDDNTFYVFVVEELVSTVLLEMTSIRHTEVKFEVLEDLSEVSSKISFDEKADVIASNRIDCIIAKAYHFSRSQASECLFKEIVFCNGKCITDCNFSPKSGDIISVRGKGKFIFTSDFSENKKGRLKVVFHFYR